MKEIILVPTIMAIAIGSVIGIKALYGALNKDENGNPKKSKVEEFTSHVEEFTADLSQK